MSTHKKHEFDRIGPRYVVVPCLRCGDLVNKRSVASVPVCGDCDKVLGPCPEYTTKNCDECGDKWTLKGKAYCQECSTDLN
jgi:hypothetical protein